MSKVLEGFKFAVYLAVPIGLAVSITVPSIRQRVLRDLGLNYPRQEERGTSPEDLRKLQERASVHRQ